MREVIFPFDIKLPGLPDIRLWLLNFKLGPFPGFGSGFRTLLHPYESLKAIDHLLPHTSAEMTGDNYTSDRFLALPLSLENSRCGHGSGLLADGAMLFSLPPAPLPCFEPSSLLHFHKVMQQWQL